MIYVFLADGFEEMEAITTIDVLKRAGYDVKIVGVNSKAVIGANKIKIEADITPDEVDLLKTKAIVLPGGMPGAINLKNSKIVLDAINYCMANEKLIAAICAAPLVLGEAGILKGKKAVCYPGFENYLDGAKILNEPICVDENIVTAKGPGVSLMFALKIVEVLSGKEAVEKIKSSMQCI